MQPMKIYTFILFLSLCFFSHSVFSQTFEELDSLGEHFFLKKDYTKAKDYYWAALSKAKTTLGQSDTLCALFSGYLGIIFSKTNEFDSAEVYYLEALKAFKQAIGENNKHYTNYLTRLASNYRAQKKFKLSENAYLKAIALSKTYKDDTNEDFAYISNLLANLYRHIGDLNNAEVHFNNAIKVKEEHSANDVTYTNLLNNLASLHREKANYRKAEELYNKSLAVTIAQKGKNHTDYAFLMNNIAVFYQEIGLYKNAEENYRTAIAIFREKLLSEDPVYLSTLNNLGTLLNNTGKLGEAEEIFNHLLQIREKTVSSAPLELWFTLNAIGKNKYLKGEYKQSYDYFKRAHDLLLENFGKNNQHYITSSNNLASALDAKGDIEAALTCHDEGLKTFRQYYGEKSNSYMLALANYTKLLQKSNRNKEAFKFFNQIFDQKYEEINSLRGLLSEKELAAYYTENRRYFYEFQTFLATHLSEEPKYAANLYNNTLNMKKFLFSSSKKMRDAILNTGDSTCRNEFKAWQTLKDNLVKFQQMPAEKRNKEGIDLVKLEVEVNEAEKKLAQKSTFFEQNRQLKIFQWEQIGKSIGKNEVAVEVIRAQRIYARDSLGKELKDTVYIALFADKKTKSHPEMLIWENGKDLETKYLSYYKNAINFKREDKLSYEQFWKPIADKLKVLNKKGYSKIYFSPDGVFHQISLNTLQNPETGKYLLEEQNIQLIGTSRDLIEFGTNETDLSKNFAEYETYMLGFPAYNLENKKTDTTKATDRSFSAVERIMGTRGAVSMLPGTKTEIENLNRMFAAKNIKTKTFLSENAREENIKQMKNPTILHIATHGFFVPEVKESDVKTMQDAEKRNLLKNPYMRSGLLLAGCENPNVEGEDGILTAEEAMNLNLDKTELVVLSACETGLGDIQTGEGVFGLQRAFQQAGAKTVLMSLWKVSDEATQMLMTEFYSALLSGKPKREAFKIAQMKLREKFESPYYWGAFVMVGR
jgi:CHAT domain-containing protein